MARVLSSQWKQILSVLAAIYLLLPSSAFATSVKYCDKEGNYAVKVKNVEISPNPVIRGQPATFKISASTTQAISSGKVVIEVSYFGVHVHTETRDLCEDVSCPVASGNFFLTHMESLPSITPPGSYTLKMSMKDNDNGQLTCISFGFKIVLGSSGPVSDV